MGEMLDVQAQATHITVYLILPFIGIVLTFDIAGLRHDLLRVFLLRYEDLVPIP